VPWAALDDGFHEDPRTLEVGLAAAGLYACATTYVARHLLDGLIPRRALARMLDGGDTAPLAALLRVGLFEEADGGYTITDYFKGNQTRGVVEERKRKAKVRAEKGARAMWAKRRETERKQTAESSEGD
jgi:hypothetical protein